MSMQINTQKHITELQAKAQAVTKKFNKEIVIVTNQSHKHQNSCQR
jgi:hypothetical protein